VFSMASAVGFQPPVVIFGGGGHVRRISTETT
jgi:hypothetical protein